MPFGKRNASFAYDIGECLGGFIEYDESDPLGWDQFMRIKVLLEIDKPLRRGLKIATGPSTTKWIDIKYERLADFCFYCGRLGHVDRECQFHDDNDDSKKEIVYQYHILIVGGLALGIT